MEVIAKNITLKDVCVCVCVHMLFSQKIFQYIFALNRITGRKNIITTYLNMSVIIIIMTFDQSHATAL